MELLQPALTLCQYFIKSHLISKEQFLFSSVNHNILSPVYYSGINLQVGSARTGAEETLRSEWQPLVHCWALDWLISEQTGNLRGNCARSWLEVISISRCQSNEQTACPSPRRWPWPWQRYLCFSIPHLGRYFTLYLQLCFASLILMYI